MNTQDIVNIIKFHGLIKGSRRVLNEIVENELFDLFNGCYTTKPVMIKDYHNNNNFDKIKHKHYQPTYYSPLKKILLNIRNSQKNQSATFIDLGTGFGKPVFIFNKFFDNANNFAFGLDLESNYEPTFKKNMRKFKSNSSFLYGKVEEFDYQNLFIKNNLLNNGGMLIIHNKNSFDKEITKKSLDKFVSISSKFKSVFYIYSNPEFLDCFDDFKLISSVTGWHKNFNINLYQIK